MIFLTFYVDEILCLFNTHTYTYTVAMSKKKINEKFDVKNLSEVNVVMDFK